MFGVSSKTGRGIIDSAAHGGKRKEFTILNEALKAPTSQRSSTGPGPFTLFAPTDAAFGQLAAGTLEALTGDQIETILRYHVVADKIHATDLSDDNLTTILGLDLTIDGMMVNDATIIEADLGASNGIIHVIDRVLDPEDAPVYPSYAQSFGLSGLEGQISPKGPDLLKTGPFSSVHLTSCQTGRGL